MSLITITQSLGSGETGLAGRVAAELKIELFDDTKLREKALEIGVQADDLASLEEKVPGFFIIFFPQFPHPTGIIWKPLFTRWPEREKG